LESNKDFFGERPRAGGKIPTTLLLDFFQGGGGNFWGKCLGGWRSICIFVDALTSLLARHADIEGKKLASAIYSKDRSRNLQVERTLLQNKVRTSTVAWAFNLSVVTGFLQVPWNVGKLIRPRLSLNGVLGRKLF